MTANSFMDAVTALARQNREQVREYVVDALGGASIYFTPLTVGDIGRIQRKHPNFLNGSDGGMSVEAMVDLIILKARDENGEKLIKPTDRDKLLMLPLDVIAAIAGEMIQSNTSIEEHVGN